MRWEDQRESQNVEDQRGRSPARRGLAIGGGGALLLLLIGVITGQNPLQLLESVGGLDSTSSYDQSDSSVPAGSPQDQLGHFASVVLANTEDVWNKVLLKMGVAYQEPRLVLFSDAVQSACGFSSSAVGPFYCPADERVYLDLSFFNELSRRFGAPGDFAGAYVIAHEVGHHIQHLLGIDQKVSRLRNSVSPEDGNRLSVMLELQADCFAGVWGYYADRDYQIIEAGDFAEALQAAAAIGDDRLQRLAQRQVQPESWTHGSSQQRAYWLKRGLQSGDPNQCNTFAEVP